MDPDQQIILALAAIITPLVGALVYLAKRTEVAAAQATQANRAVNNVGPGDHSLWDQIHFLREDVQELVEAQKEFARLGWMTLPDDIATAAKLTETIREIQHEQRDIGKDVKALRDQLTEHDRWERQKKYGG